VAKLSLRNNIKISFLDWIDGLLKQIRTIDRKGLKSEFNRSELGEHWRNSRARRGCKGVCGRVAPFVGSASLFAPLVHTHQLPGRDHPLKEPLAIHKNPFSGGFDRRFQFIRALYEFLIHGMSFFRRPLRAKRRLTAWLLL
jgi:hypothetical protein